MCVNKNRSNLDPDLAWLYNLRRRNKYITHKDRLLLGN